MAAARSERSPDRSRLSVAVQHPLNLLMLTALGASAVLTGSLWPVLVAAIAEAAWALAGPRTDAVRAQHRLVAQRSRERAQIGGEQALLRQTSEADRRRFLELDQVRRDIRKLVEGHDSLSLEMMAGELHKVDQLLTAFLRVAATANAQERILADTDVVALELALESGGADAKALAEARLDGAKKLRAAVANARQQMDRVAERLRLVRDQVATMRAPEDLGAALDDLVETVEVIEATGRETERIGRGMLAGQTVGS